MDVKISVEKLLNENMRGERMKRFVALLLVILFIVSVLFIGTGCKEEAAEEVGEAEETTATETITEESIEGGTLNYLGWQGYDGGESIKSFLEENNITMNNLFVTSNEEIFSKLKVGGGGRYDVVTPNHSTTPSFIKSDLLEPLDLTQIPNYENLFEVFKNLEYNKSDGEIYTVPLTWGSQCMQYNADVITEKPTSWDILLDPQYKGKVVTQDNAVGNITIVAVWLGFKDHATQLTKDELQQCYERLLELKQNLRYIAPTFGDCKNALVSGEALFLFNGWEPIALWAQQEGANIQSVIPDEGTAAFIDNYAIAKGSPNKDIAYAYINAMLDPNVQASFAKEISTAAVNKDAIQFMDEDVASTFPYDSIEEYFAKAIPYPEIPLESDEYATLNDWVEMWEQFKAAE